MKAYVLSIKKSYGLNLLNCTALWEYRKRRSLIKAGDRIILYATSPHKELIGEFTVGEVLVGSPEDIWEKTKLDVCYMIEDVVPYLKSGDYPIAFKVESPKLYEKPIPLSRIAFFKPPVSYCEVPEQLASKVLSRF